MLTNAAIDLAIFLGATAATYTSQIFDRPITAALIYLAGVTIIGARSGMISGVVAALAATVIYSYVLTEPIYQFSSYSLDDLVPLVAFNVSAILSGFLVGRLNDRAFAAGAAEQRNAFLLRVSNDLQKTLSLEDVSRAARRWLPFRQIVELELYIVRSDELVGIGGASKWHDAAQAAYLAAVNHAPPVQHSELAMLVLRSADKPIGVAVFTRTADLIDVLPQADSDAFANLLNITTERCLLMEKLAEAEIIQKSEVLKTAILSSVSHDLRTPLTAIEASATSMLYLGETLKGEDKTAMLETILEQCERLNRYTSNILYMGQLQYGIPEEQIEEVDAVDILGAVILSVRKLFPSLTIQKDFSAATATNVRANPVMLEQLFFNIIENAAKYGGPEKDILIEAKLVGASIEIAIVDWGPGISLEDQERVFDKFYRTAQTKRSEGNGLGLGIAKGFAEAFGGTIKVVSPHTRGAGTEMLISLPISRNGIRANEL